MDGFYNVSLISIARSGAYLHKLSPKDAVLHEVITWIPPIQGSVNSILLGSESNEKEISIQHIS